MTTWIIGLSVVGLLWLLCRDVGPERHAAEVKERHFDDGYK